MTEFTPTHISIDAIDEENAYHDAELTLEAGDQQIVVYLTKELLNKIVFTGSNILQDIEIVEKYHTTTNEKAEVQLNLPQETT